jgi:hypothetical protein
MGSIREGGYVRQSYTRTRRPVQILVRADDVSIGYSQWVKIGVETVRAREAKMSFSNELYRVGLALGNSNSLPPPHLNGVDSPDLELWQEEMDEWERKELLRSLTLDTKLCQTHLRALRMIGADLRADLDEKFLEELRKSPIDLKDPSESRVLAFIQESGESPRLWDMMYEGGVTDSPDWRLFWGVSTAFDSMDFHSAD